MLQASPDQEESFADSSKGENLQLQLVLDGLKHKRMTTIKQYLF